VRGGREREREGERERRGEISGSGPGEHRIQGLDESLPNVRSPWSLAI
jgi:hypothetical protein